MNTELLLFFAFVITVFFSVTFLTWRQCVKVLLVLLVVEGALRKWAFPLYGTYTFFAKDLIALSAYIKYYSSASFKQNDWREEPVIFFVVIASAVVCVVQAFNPNLGSPVVGIFGVKNYLFYIPLMYLMRHLFRSVKELYKFLRWYLLLVIPVGLLGFLQYFSPLESFVNVYARGAGTATITPGGSVRITGTFSFISGYTMFLVFCAALTITLLPLKQARLWRFASILVLLVGVTNMLMTGSRTPVIALGLFLTGYALCNNIPHALVFLRKSLIPVVICSVALAFWFRPQLDEFMERVEATGGKIIYRISGGLTAPYGFLGDTGLIGYGAGATYQGSSYIRKAFHLPAGKHIQVGYEAEPGRVMLELGPIGFVLWYSLRILIIFALWKTIRRLKIPLLRRLALTGFLIHVIMITNFVVFNVFFCNSLLVFGRFYFFTSTVGIYREETIGKKT